MSPLICLLMVLGMGNCLEHLPTRGEIETSINRTIEEVERMVGNDPSLPRLTRNQIVDILFNITASDMTIYEKSVEKTRKDYQRALMIVLPYNSNDTKGESLVELYTKAPLTKIIKEPSRDLEPAFKDLELTSTDLEPSSKDLDQTSKDLDQTSKDLDNGKDAKTGNQVSKGPEHYNNHRDTYADVQPVTSTQESLRILLKEKNKDPTPEKFSLTLENFGTSSNAQSYVRPIYNNVLTDRDPIKDNSNLEIVYSTSVTQRPTTKLAATVSYTESGFRPTMPPVRSTENVLTSDQWRYNAPPSSTTSRPSINTKNLQWPTKIPFLPTVMAEKEPKTSTGEIRSQKDHAPSWGTQKPRVDDQEKTVPLYVTPMSSTSLRQPGDSTTAKSEPKTTKMPMREEVQDLLASIGLHPGRVKDNDVGTSNRVSDVHEKLFGTNFQIPESTNVIAGPTSGLTAVGDASPSLSSQNTFERTPQDVRKGVDNLSPDVQLLFQRFGLQSSAKDPEFATKRPTEKPRVHTTRTSFWNNFKPLPVSQVKDEGMKDFLAKFGLGIEDSRKEKSMNTEPDRPPSLIEAVPADMKRILENIGLITKSRKAQDTSRIQTIQTPPLHVFKPHETAIEDEQQRAKINELLDTVKLVQDGRADVSEVQKVAKELLETTKSLKNGPDPLSLEEILRIYNNDLKNEIKRQQDSKDLADVAISEIGSTAKPEVEASSMASSLGVVEPSGASSDTATTSTNSTESKGSVSLFATLPTETANLESLADSFGGTTLAPDTALPTPRKTGLYFLVDWNTFLEVGEDEKDKVNLRFQPKVGDRTRFLPVTVP